MVSWYSSHLKNFPQLVVIHRVKGFSVVNEAEVDVFLEFSCFFYDPVNVGNLMSGFTDIFSVQLVNVDILGSHTVEAQLEGFGA